MAITEFLNEQNVVTKCNYYRETLFDYNAMHFH